MEYGVTDEPPTIAAGFIPHPVEYSKQLKRLSTVRYSNSIVILVKNKGEMRKNGYYRLVRVLVHLVEESLHSAGLDSYLRLFPEMRSRPYLGSKNKKM